MIKTDPFELLRSVLGAEVIEIRNRYTGLIIWSRLEGSSCEVECDSVES
jgi:hypothetical protein